MHATNRGGVTLLDLAHGDQLVTRNFGVMVAFVAVGQDHIRHFDALACHLDDGARTRKIRVIGVGHDDQHPLNIRPIWLQGSCFLGHRMIPSLIDTIVRLSANGHGIDRQ